MIFAQQAELSVLFPFDALSRVMANAVIGEYSPAEALDILLAGTGVEASIEHAERVTVRIEVPTETEPNAFSRALGAWAGDADAQFASRDRRIEEVTVTGTRLRYTNGMLTPVPVTAISPDELSGFEPGATVAEQLDILPQFFRNRTAQRGSDGPGGGNVISGHGGASYLDMRALGPQRTLVLLDGQRMMPADKRGSVNVDTFPLALVRSVDVVTGGASAAYGADALGGVANFVIDRGFEGLDIRVGTGTSEWRDGDRWNLSVAGGTRIGERFNLIGSIEARRIDQIWRDPAKLPTKWHHGLGYVTNPEWYPGAPPGIPQRLTLPWVASSRSSPTGIIRAKVGSADTDPLIPFRYNEYTFLEDGSGVRPFDRGEVYADPLAPGSTFTLSGGPEAEIYNRAFDAGPFGAEVKGRSAFAAIRYQLTSDISLFAQVLEGRSESNYEQKRGDFYLAGGQHATVFRDNAYLPEEIGLAMDEAGIDSFQLHKAGSFLGNIDPGAGARNLSAFETTSWSFGLDAAFADNWNVRATWQSGRSEKHTAVRDEIRIDRLFLAADAVRHPETGDIVCRVQLFDPSEEELYASIAHLGLESSRGGPLMSPIGLDDTIRDCVPFNIMGAGNMSREAQKYVMTPVWGESFVEQDFAEIVLTGDAFDLPAGRVSFAAGLTWRRQSFGETLHPEEVDRLGPPQNAPEIGIQGFSPRWFASQATLWQFTVLPTIAGRYAVWEWFAETKLPIFEQGVRRLDTSFALRSSDYSRGSKIESWKIGIDFQVVDALRLRATQSRDAREATFAERFDASVCGVPVRDPEFDGTVFQIVGICGGNPNLRPELADTRVIGAVLQPPGLDGLSVSADWYDIQVHDAVGALGVQRIVDECYGGVRFLCDQIVRDPITNTISTVYDYYLNVDRSKVEGIDFELAYDATPNFFPRRSERVDVRLLAGYVKERSDTPLGGNALDVAGSLLTPDLTAVATVRYHIDRFGVQLQQRYIAETLRDAAWVEGVDVDDNTVSSGNFTNLRLTYDGETSTGGAWRAALDVANLFDRPPPIVPSVSYHGGRQVVDSAYDRFGRRYMLSFNIGF